MADTQRRMYNSMKKIPILAWVLFIAMAVTLTACAPPDEAPPVDPPPIFNEVALSIEVEARANRFSPDDIQVPLGEPVQFVVTSVDEFHTFTVKVDADDPIDLFNLEVPAGETREMVWTFEEPGEYYLYCIPHEAFGMVGTITVTD